MDPKTFKAQAKTFLIVGYAFETPALRQQFHRNLMVTLKSIKMENLFDLLLTDQWEKRIQEYLDALDKMELEKVLA